MHDDLLFRPITELGALVSSGELTARELVETALRRIEDLDGDVNAFTHVHADEALAAADAVQPGDPRPFAGVPVAIKTEVAVEAALRRIEALDPRLGAFVAVDGERALEQARAVSGDDRRAFASLPHRAIEHQRRRPAGERS